MDESAESLRALRKRETARHLTEAARRLTAEHGFTGYTIEQLCAEVGVSRRTFFNYFDTKESAILGLDGEDPRLEALADAFVTQGRDQGRDLVEDFIELQFARWDLVDPLSEAPVLFAIFDREPRLVKGMFDRMAENERRDVRLIAAREGFDDDDLRAEVIVHTVGALFRLAADQILNRHSLDPIRTHVNRRLSIARNVLATPRKPTE